MEATATLTVPISKIRENPVALRTVDKTSEKFLGLVASIRKIGFVSSITVRELLDSATGEMYYELVDGLHRFTAAKEAGLEMLPVIVQNNDKSGVLSAQLMLNFHRVETKPCEYSRQLRRLFAEDPLLTVGSLAGSLGVTPQWISDRLSLQAITDPKIQKLIDEGKIVLANAYALAKLPPEEQAQQVDAAMTQPAVQFGPTIQKRIKEIKEANRKGGDAPAAVFAPVAYMQKPQDVKDEMASLSIGRALIAATQTSTPEEAWKLALQWMLHLDQESVSAQKAEYDARQAKKAEELKKRQEAKAAREAERKNAAESAAAKVAAEISE